jgi:anti-sigma B factor antagonist
MEINHIINDKIQIVELVGRLDALNNAKMEAFFNQLTDNPDLDIITDCEKLDFINSSGLRVFILSLKKLKPANKRLIICNLQKNIKDVFIYSGFTNLFDIHLSKEEAIKLLE